MERIKSDANVANVQCFYPLEANIETTGQCCILLGSEFYFRSNYYSVGSGLCRLELRLQKILSSFVSAATQDVSPINCSTLFILDELSSKYFQSVIKMSTGASRNLPEYIINCSEIPSRSVWDSHCHLDFLARKLARERNVGGNILEISLQRDGLGLEEKFGGCVANFCDPWDWTQGARGDKISSLIDVCCAEERVFLTLGCHPHFADKLDDAGIDQLRILVGSLKGRVVAIGECGLDISHKNEVPLDVQKRVFGAQVQLALDLNMPLVLHIRGAEEEAFEVLRKKRVPSDWPMHYHCFKGNVEQAEQWFNDYPASKIGLTGLVTFPHARQVHEVARQVPLEKILLETDAPYFLPASLGGTSYQYNFSQPGHVVHAAAQVIAMLMLALFNIFISL